MYKMDSTNNYTAARIQKMRDEIPTLAKRANQRLREIEKRGLQETSSAYQMHETAVKSGMEYTRLTSKGEIAFRTDKGRYTRTDSDIIKEYNKLKQFLNAKTSTATGIEQMHKKQYNKYKKAGGQMSFVDFAAQKSKERFWDLVRAFDYYTAIDLYEEYDENEIETAIDNIGDLRGITIDELLQEIETANAESLDINPDDE